MFFPQEIILKIKKIFFNKRGVSFLILGLIIFSSLFSPSFAGAAAFLAGALGVVFGIVQGAAIVIAIYAFIDLISIAFVNISGAFLNWVTSPGFVSISYTNPSGPNGNPIIAAGLDITKSTVNLGLVLFLVYIAVAIALRLGETDAKKSLAKLIVIALLVNFAPLLVGLIVDASNIAMNYSLVGIGQSIANVLTQSSELGGSTFTAIWGMVTLQPSIVARGLIVIVLNFATGAALFLYAALFLFRYIVIWILVILSPLAFVSLIHPFFKKMVWDIWWKQVWEWSFVGAFMAFFLYMGARCYELLPVLFKTRFDTAGIGPEVAGIMNQTFPYFVVVVFLYLGFIMGLQTGAMGAGAVIGFSKKTGSWLTGKIWKGTKRWTEEKAQTRERVGKLTKLWETAPVARWFLPEQMRKYGQMRPAIDEAEKELINRSSKELVHGIKVGDLYGIRAAAALRILTSRGDMEDYFTAMREKYKATSDEKLLDDPRFIEKTGRYLQIALQGGYHNTLLRADPRLAAAAPSANIPGYDKFKDIILSDGTVFGVKEQAIAKATTEARRQHIINMEREVPENETFVEYGMTKGREFFEAITVSTKKGQETTLKTIDKLFTAFIDAADPAMKVLAQSPVADDRKKAWNAYNQHFLERHKGTDYQGLEGYFTAAATDNRFRSLGWREGWYQGTPPPGGSVFKTPAGGGGPAPGGTGPSPGGGGPRGRGPRRGRGGRRRPGGRGPTPGGATGVTP